MPCALKTSCWHLPSIPVSGTQSLRHVPIHPVNIAEQPTMKGVIAPLAEHPQEPQRDVLKVLRPIDAMNSPFTQRKLFIHKFETGIVLHMKVDATKHETRFAFTWNPPLQSIRELEEISDEMVEWRDYWLGGELGPSHSIPDLMLYHACQNEVEQLIERLPP